MGLSALMALAVAGCDSGGGGSTSGGGTATTTTDGTYTPPPNGVRGTEKQACDALVDKVEQKFLALKCIGTTQTCPSFLRAQFKTPCMEYDLGSVEGCIEYYDQQKTCASLKEATEKCFVTPYPGSEPAGCPTPGTGGMGGTGGTGGTAGTGGIGGTGGVGGTGGTGGTAGSGGTGGTAGSGMGSVGSSGVGGSPMDPDAG